MTTVLNVISLTAATVAIVLCAITEVLRRKTARIVNRCPGHKVGDTVQFVQDDGTALRVTFGTRAPESEIADNVTASLRAYTTRTDQPPTPGVCDCYRDFTGIRLPLRRPCPVHGTTTSREGGGTT
jgi:hypothetical protein